MKRSASTDTHPLTFLQLLEQAHRDWLGVIAIVVYSFAIAIIKVLTVSQHVAEELVGFVPEQAEIGPRESITLVVGDASTMHGVGEDFVANLVFRFVVGGCLIQIDAGQGVDDRSPIIPIVECVWHRITKPFWSFKGPLLLGRIPQAM